MKWLVLVLVIIGLILGGSYVLGKNRGGSVTSDKLVREWTLESFNNQKTDGSITFNNDGKFSAKVCNSYGGSYEFKNGYINFNNVAGTLMLCTNSNLRNAEIGFSKITQNGAKVQIENGKLKLQNGNNSLLFR